MTPASLERRNAIAAAISSTTFDKSRGIAVPLGGVVAIPPGVPHFAWLEEETVVHVHGVGPRIAAA
jgi:hypothetical protein